MDVSQSVYLLMRWHYSSTTKAWTGNFEVTSETDTPPTGKYYSCCYTIVLLEEELARQERRTRTVWVKPWLLRRTTLGHYDTLMQDLMRESRGDL